MSFTTLTVSGASAVAALNQRRAEFAKSGEYPFLIGNQENVERLKESAEYNEDTMDNILSRAIALDVTEWLKQRREEAEEFEFSEEETLGEWPGEIDDKMSLSLHLEVLSRKPLKDAFIGLVRITNPWKLPAVLKYGNWNDCPAPEVHCAIHKLWEAQFGAEIAGVSGDTVECVVANPPRTKEAALALAWQQCWYCTDIVYQGCGSVNNLAASLMNSNGWFFWWD
jgi:hypothetical protein